MAPIDDRIVEGDCNTCGILCSSRCSFCRTVFYCGRDHQKEDWPSHKKTCTRKKYRMDTNDKIGRHLTATENIEAGNVIFKDKPLVVAPKMGLLDTDDAICVGCFKLFREDDEEAEGEIPELSYVNCPSCSLPVCSLDCAAMYFHRQFECRLLSESGLMDGASKSSDIASLRRTIRENILQNLLYFRCLLLKHMEDDFNWRQLMDLLSNIEFRDDLPNLEKTTRIFEEIKNTMTAIDHPVIKAFIKPDLHRILGILDTNAIDVKISPGMELTCVYPTFSLMEYSCIPSTRFYFMPSKTSSPGRNCNFELCVRAAVDLKPGDHLSCTITHVLWNTLKRREELKKTKYFWCECSRCMDPTELGSNFSSILCPIQTCKGVSIPVAKQAKKESTKEEPPTDLMSPKVTTDREFQWQCVRCGKTCETWQVKKVDQQLAETVGKVTGKGSVELYKSLLSQIEQVVHPDYYLTFVLNHSLIQIRGEEGKEEEEAEVGPRKNPPCNSKEWLDERLKICNRLLKTMYKLDPGLAKLNVYAAVVYFEMHGIILISAGGETEDDFKVLRQQPESVKLAQVYLQKCIECFQYELTYCPEIKLQMLAKKKLEYLFMLLKHSSK